MNKSEQYVNSNNFPLLWSVTVHAFAGGAFDNWFYSDNDSFDDYEATSISCGGIGVALSNEHLSSYSNDDLDSGGL